MTPAFALAENEAGRIILMPPTLKTIEELLSFSHTAQLFAAARSQRIGRSFPRPSGRRTASASAFPTIRNTR